MRAYTPWPGTFTYCQGELLKVLRGAALVGEIPGAAPGTLSLHGGMLVVQTGSGLYRLDEIQPAGKRPMSGVAFLAGRADGIGGVLGD